jgi:hypothetical protein
LEFKGNQYATTSRKFGPWKAPENSTKRTTVFGVLEKVEQLETETLKIMKGSSQIREPKAAKNLICIYVCIDSSNSLRKHATFDLDLRGCQVEKQANKLSLCELSQ